MIKSKGKEYSFGQMVGNMMGSGLMESSMELGIIIVRKGIVRRQYGKEGRGLSGLKIIIIIIIILILIIVS